MKAVMLALRYLTNAFGNIIDVAVIAALEGKLGSQVSLLIKIEKFLFKYFDPFELMFFWLHSILRPHAIL